MGLDMSLYKKHYVKNWEHMKPEAKTFVSITGKKALNIKPEKIAYITEDIAYWRKANQIHSYFVNNYNGGDDNNGTIYIGDASELQKLLDIINTVLSKSKLVHGAVTNGYKYENGTKTAIIESGLIIEDSKTAEELLPTGEGFFFGSTEYDEGYIQDLEYTKKIIEEELAIENNDAEYEYHASW